MKNPSHSNYRSKIIYLRFLLLLMGIAWFLNGPDLARGDPPLNQDDFAMVAPKGFGDRHNSWTWSMIWWDEHLYVGTNRAWHCAEVSSFHLLFPGSVPYPPTDPDVECTPDPEDLPLQAEIWRWTPDSDTWERVFQSPNDVLLLSGKAVARDAGFRGMAIFEEADGTEALYVTGVSPSFVYDPANNLPPPRILRSVDGVNFTPVPQDPGTFLGDFPFNSLRSPVSYNGRLYVVGGVVQGSGVLMEAENPAGGNDNFRMVSPPGFDLIVSRVETFNNFLYVGTHDIIDGYSVFKTDATGDPPYTYTPVVGSGGYLTGPGTNSEVLHMKVFNNRLYVGGNGLRSGSSGGDGIPGAAELIRINPDDTWDVVVGEPRLTPDGPKSPISGLLAGFDNIYNAHMWRLEVFDENLYVGTFDSSTTFKDDPTIGPTLEDIMGFDLYRTSNGSDFVPVTTTGFDDKFDFGVRALVATPYGLFLGTANYYYGLEVWRAPQGIFIYFPAIFKDAASGPISSTSPSFSDSSQLSETQASGQVDTEVVGSTVVVSWEPLEEATQYHIFRSEIENSPYSIGSERGDSTENLEGPQMSISSQAVEIGATTGFYFVDRRIRSDRRYIYHVEASDGMGRSLVQSNVAAAPSVASPVTFSSLAADLLTMQSQGYLTPAGMSEIAQTLATIQAQCDKAEFVSAAQNLAILRKSLEPETQSLMAPWKAEDLSRLLSKLERRIRLVQVDILDLSDLK